MFINKVSSTNAADLYFDTMLKYNEKSDESIIKEASTVGTMLENLGKITRVSDEAADAA